MKNNEIQFYLLSRNSALKQTLKDALNLFQSNKLQTLSSIDNIQFIPNSIFFIDQEILTKNIELSDQILNTTILLTPDPLTCAQTLQNQFKRSLCFEEIDAQSLQLLIDDLLSIVRTNKALENSLEQYITLVNHSPDTICLINQKGDILFINQIHEGYSLEKVEGSSVFDYMSEFFIKKYRKKLKLTIEKQLPQELEVQILDGRFFSVRLVPIIENKVTHNILVISSDISELKESENRYRALVEASFEGLMLSVDHLVVEANQSLATMLGFEQANDLIGMGPLERATPETSAKIIENIKANFERPYEGELLKKDGSILPVEIIGKSTTFKGKKARITGIRDISARKTAEQERKKIEEQFMQTQKLESLGILAGGIAHDFNNLLVSILGNAELAQLSIPENNPAQQYMQRLINTSHTAADLSKQMLAYSGHGQFILTDINLSELIQDMLHLLEVSITKSTQLTCQFSETPPLLKGDITQIRQVIMNLLINASESFSGKPGKILIKTGHQDDISSELENSDILDIEKNIPYIFCEVSDNGSGMDDETLNKLFDPFFTTKFTGRGLGLSVAQGIVRGHKGFISVNSQPNQGTTFKIFFPALTIKVTPTRAKEKSPLACSMEAHQDYILIIDDEDSVRLTIESALEFCGYQSLSAINGQTGLEIFKKFQDQIKMVILDLVMPDLTGEQVLQEIHKLSPDCPILLISGFKKKVLDQLICNKPHVQFLLKPFRIKKLSDEIEYLLKQKIDMKKK